MTLKKKESVQQVEEATDKIQVLTFIVTTAAITIISSNRCCCYSVVPQKR